MDLTKHPGRPLIASYVLGIVTAASLNNLIQDWMGQAAYIEYLRDHWITMPWQIDAAIIVWALWALNRLGDKVFRKYFDERVADALSRVPEERDRQDGERKD